MVDPEAFLEAREILTQELENAYHGVFLIPPVEVAPGYWAMWPDRRVTLILKETGASKFGKPAKGAGVLQAHVEWPYGQGFRIRSGKGMPFDREDAEDAAHVALKASKDLAAHYGDDRIEAQEAYVEGYQDARSGPEEDMTRIWIAREETFRDAGAKWDKLWRSIDRYIGEPGRGVLDWLPERRVDPKYHGRMRERYVRGFLEGVDDWAYERGLLKVVVGPEGPRWAVD